MNFKRGHPYKGMLISFVGTEGCGKSTQRKRLWDYLSSEGFETVVCVDPHGVYRDLLLNPDKKQLCRRTELFVFMAARAELVEEFAKPALEQGKIVLYEQYRDASRVYQGNGRGLPIRTINFLNEFATDNIQADLTFLFDLKPENAKVTIDEFGRKDKFESLPLTFHEKVCQGYLQLAQEEPERFRVIYYREDVEGMHLEVRQEFEKFVEHFSLRDKLLRRRS